MPVSITKDNVTYNIVPAPLVSFTKQVYNNVGRAGFGADFSIALQGTLIPYGGNPTVGGFVTDDMFNTPETEPGEIVALSGIQYLDATIRKQEHIRKIFSNPVESGVAKPIKIDISGWNDQGSGISFMGFVDDISFDAGSRWANPTSYTVNIRTSSFLHPVNSGSGIGYEDNTGWLISSLTDNFDIQEDSRTTLIFNNLANTAKTLKQINKVYNVSRSITAVGSPVYDESGAYRSGAAPWQQASGFIYEYLQPDNTGQTPTGRFDIFSSGANSGWREANVVYQETIDKEAGSYSLSKSYILYSGLYPVIETISINEDIGENRVRAVTVQGTIQGLNTASGFAYSGNAYLNADSYYYTINGSGTGLPEAYYYARGAITPPQSSGATTSTWLHPSPLSQTIGRDFSAGTITYSYNFDDRPPNIVRNSISESIQINDTYPGEIFSVTPVIGRSQPVLQYLNSRSEYKRSLSINVVMGAPTGYLWNTNISGQVDSSGKLTSNQIGVLQNLFLTQKPSISNREELQYIYQAANPANDPNFSIYEGKCFHSAPTESWDARTRTYTYNVEWTYERK